MERLHTIWNASLLSRLVAALSGWFGRQWEQSALVQAFLAPVVRSQASSRNSVFARLWQQIHRLLCALYDKLRLERVFRDSIFLQVWFWCMLPVVLAPVLPTMVVMALTAVSMCVMVLAFARSRERELSFSPINKYILIYAGVYLLGTAASVTPAAGLKEGLLRVLFVLFPLVLLNALNSRAQLLGVVKLMVLMGAVVSVYGMYQYVFRTGYQSAAWVDSDMFSAIGFRVGSTFDNPNMLGQYLVLLIPLGGACLLRARTGKERGVWFVCCALMCACMLLTFSRGAWLALLCAGLAFFVLLNPRLLLLAPFALVALYFVLPETVIQRFTSIGDLADNSTSYRVSIWLGTLRMLKDYWLCGVGPGQTAFNTVYPAYGYDEIIAPHSHNLLLQITTEAGICALVIFCLLLFWYFRGLCSGLHREKDPTGRMLQIACISGVGGFMVQSMTDYSFYNYRVMFLFWAFLALGMAAARWHELEGEDRL